MPTPLRNSSLAIIFIATIALLAGFSSNLEGQSFEPVSFSSKSRNLLSFENYSGVCIGVSDMNGDGKDDIIRYDSGNVLNIQYQNSPNSPFTSKIIRRVAITSQWATAIADVDRNGYNDIIVGGVYDNLKIIKNMNGEDDFVASNIPNSLAFVQGTNFVDIDNDGHIDIFSCNDEAESLKFRNDGTGSFVNTTGLLDTKTRVPSDDSGNYASIWTDHDNDGDLDLYISKCKDVATQSTDPRRINMLFENDGQNNYTEVGEAAGLAIGDQTWMTDFADIDNDGDMDAYVVNHYTRSQLMENNGDGTYTDITPVSGLLPTLSANSGVFAIQSLFRDFNNDGFVDLLITGSEHFLFYNNGDQTFSQQTAPFGSDQIESAAIGDLNDDGFLDIYAGYAKFFTNPSDIPDDIFINQGNDNNYISILLKGITSNSNGIGARVELYGAWGKQIREVRSGEGYGIMNSFTQHFGLGDETDIEKIVVRWPSGIIQEVENPMGNSFMVIEEVAECTGQACNDNDACTINDIYNADCECIGTLQDSDGDGVCNAEDVCPGYDDALDTDQDGVPDGCDECDSNLAGQRCNDGNPCTENETYNNNCECVGTVVDADNDGICDAIDSCPNFDNGLIGLPCNDGDVCTVGERWTNNCDCQGGQYVDADGDGVCVGDDADDNNPCVPDPNNVGCDDSADGCTLINFTGFEGDNLGLWEDGGAFARIIKGTEFATTGESSFYLFADEGAESSLVSQALPVSTYEEIKLTFSFYAYNVEPGDAFAVELAEDGVNFVNLTTLTTGVDYNNYDRKTTEIVISGIRFKNTLKLRIRSLFPEATDYVMLDDVRIEGCGEVIALPCVIGEPCNDGDPCTIGETYNGTCGCVGGQYQDSDSDGICDAQDICPTFDNRLVGTPCNDGIECTTGETYDNNCGCSGGIESDLDGDGICAAIDPDDNDPCKPNAVGANCTDEGVGPINCEVLAYTGFENGDLGQWIDGGESARLLSSTTYAFEGIYSLYLQSNEGQASSIFTQDFDVENYTNLVLSFNLLTNSVEEGDQLIVEVATNGSYFTYATMTTGQEILNNTRYDVLLEIRGITFTNRTSVRIRSLANSASDFFVLDNVKLEGCSNSIATNCIVGASCDDGNPCTEGSVYDASCSCTGGSVQDRDLDGICDGEDACPNFDNNLIGQSCNDGDPCTIGEVWSSNCACEGGIYTDADNDGYCVGYDADDQDPCLPDATTDACDEEIACNTLYKTDFEDEDLGIWIDGGASAKLFGSPTYAYSGQYSFYLQANNGVASSIYTQELNLMPYSEVQLEFFFHAFSMEADDEFYLEIGRNGVFEIVKTFKTGIDFNTNDRLIATVNFSNYSFTQNTVLRIRAGASGNDDYIILDDITIRGCTLDTVLNCDVGSACNDGDICTVGETWDSNCNCTGGTITDADGDGYCAGLDSDDNDPCQPEYTSSACINQENTTLVCSELSYVDFETNETGKWNDGGEFARLLRSDELAQSGSYLFYIQADNGVASSLFSDPLLLANAESVELSFYLHPYDVEGVDKLHIDIAKDGGAYEIYKTYVHGIDFFNLVPENVQLIIENIQFTDNTKIRFRSDCNSTSDYLLLDDIKIEKCAYEIDNRQRAPSNDNPPYGLLAEARLYPNPAQNHVTIAIPYTNATTHELDIYNLIGAKLGSYKLQNTLQKIDISHLPENQLYLFNITEYSDITGERQQHSFRVFKN